MLIASCMINLFVRRCWMGVLKVGGIDFFQYQITIPTNTSVLLKTD